MICMPFDGIVTKAVTNELQEAIIPGKINKIYQPTSTELVLQIRSQGKNRNLLLSIHPTYARIHLTADKYTNPDEAPMFCMVLRKHLSGATIESIEQSGLERIITFTIKARNEIGDVTNKSLVIELMGKHSNIMLLDIDKGIIIDSLKHVSMAFNRHRTILPGQAYILPPAQDKLNLLEIDTIEFTKRIDLNAGLIDTQIVQILVGMSPFIAKEIVHQAGLGNANQYADAFTTVQNEIIEKAYQPAIYRGKREDFHVLPVHYLDSEVELFPTANTMLDRFYSGKAERDRVKQQGKDLYRFIKNEKDKNTRKFKKHEQTLTKAENAGHYQKLGELLTAHIHLVKMGNKEITVTDYYDPDQGEVTIQLHPQKTPSENAQTYFKTYQKMKTSKRIIEVELAKTKREIDYLDQLIQQLETAREADIEEIREELRAEGYLKKQTRKKQRKNKPKKPQPEEFIATDGTVIYVGKNNTQNEYVTTKLARRDDTWLHALGIPGSHVVIQSDDPSDETLLEAAMLAAYFSKAGQSASVPVDYTKVRHVKKPNGAKPGFVTYDQQKSIQVTPTLAFVEKLKQNKKATD